MLRSLDSELPELSERARRRSETRLFVSFLLRSIDRDLARFLGDEPVTVAVRFLLSERDRLRRRFRLVDRERW